ncbi:MAG: hypothetical protein AB2652_04845 [Candidatus Thiodiazotropha endolucinida]
MININWLDPSETSITHRPEAPKYTVITIVHGNTHYQWINRSKEDVESRFHEIMEERNFVSKDLEPQTAEGLVTQVGEDGEFFIWVNASDDIQKFNAYLLDQIRSGKFKEENF